MANRDRRGRLRDAAIEVLAEQGGRGLTHRAVDAAAGVPPGTSKNYFPTRQSLLQAIAERCVELYRDLPRPVITDRATLVAMMGALLAEAAGPGRQRLLAYLELHAEAARAPWLAAILDGIAAADLTAFEEAQRAAGLPVTPERAAAVTLAMHAAIPHLLVGGPHTLAAVGLDDPGRFARDLLDAVYGRAEERSEEYAHGHQPVPRGGA
ncbi:AcrR family transcriptional regulator [Nonomuraea muscovyensis]|uniref:AcrR family transcriptional regulator n=1 Tax=Nonomuraea muscovyensis TaxID=1124761 RepID=A0A7X0C4A5_9ACTN|nr:TetR family transcriptional regulator [Nonomuraea muscovyensis]MBB6348142.1 AcrR family transcriptional regulator [Nonomuraea muscovyensis]